MLSKHDLGLIKLIEPINKSLNAELELLRANSICLPEKLKSYTPDVVEYAHIAGWGPDTALRLGSVLFYTRIETGEPIGKD